MYGKLFASLFTGSMRGKGDLQLVFAYMISNCTEDGICDFTPECIADATGKPLQLILDCIRELSEPDEMSRTRTDKGRRIRLLDPERPWGWQIVNHSMYRSIASRDAMKEAERLRKAEYRSLKKSGCPGHVRDVPGRSAYASASVSSSESVPKESPENQSANTCGKYSQMVSSILQCRPEFSRIRPEDVATELRLAEGLGLEEAEFKKRMDEFMRDAANCLDPAGVKVPLRMLRAYMQGKPATGSGQRGYKTCTDLGTGGL